MDLVVDLNFRMDTSALYSDIVLPAATWYEKDDLNTTDMHSFINPMQAAVAPAWESKSDWDIYKAIAKKVSELASTHLPEPVHDIVMLPLQHDTPDELAQPEVRDWKTGEVEAIPGKTMPKFRVVTRDYAHLYEQMVALGRGVEKNGVAAHGLTIPVADEYQRWPQRQPRQVNGRRLPVAGRGARGGRSHPGARPGLQRRAGPPRLRGRRAQDRPAPDRPGRGPARRALHLRRHRQPSRAGC